MEAGRSLLRALIYSVIRFFGRFNGDVSGSSDRLRYTYCIAFGVYRGEVLVSVLDPVVQVVLKHGTATYALRSFVGAHGFKRSSARSSAWPGAWLLLG